MVLRFLNNESKTIVGAASIVGVLSLVSRVFGFIRDRVLSGTFGAGDTLDAYYAAFKVPDLLFGLIVVGSLSAGFIPVFTRSWGNSATRARAWSLTNNIFTLVMSAMAILCLALAVFTPALVPLIAPGFAPWKQELVAQFMRIMLLAQFLLGGSLVFGSALQGMRRFALYSLAPILYNIGIIIGAVFLVPLVGAMGLAWGVVIGALFHIALQAYGLFDAGFTFQPKFALRDRELREVIALTGPRMVGIAVSQFTAFILMVLATMLPGGSVTMFQFAYNIQFFPVGLIGVSFAIAAFPSFSEHLEKRDHEGFLRVFGSSVRQVLFFILPLTVLFLAVRAQIVRVVVGTGAFDWAATIATADALAFFALSFVSQCLVYLLARVFFALHDTVTPLVAGLVAGLVGILAAFTLRDTLGIGGLAAAFTLASYVNLLLLWIPLRQRFGSLGEASWLPSVYKSLASAIFAFILMYGTKNFLSSFVNLDTFWSVFLHGFISGMVGLAGYVLSAHLMRSSELKDVIAGLRLRIRRNASPIEAVAPDTTVV